MAHSIKKIYKPGSPGWARNEQDVTLTAIKKEIKRSIASERTSMRRAYVSSGLLGARS